MPRVYSEEIKSCKSLKFLCGGWLQRITHNEPHRGDTLVEAVNKTISPERRRCETFRTYGALSFVGGVYLLTFRLYEALAEILNG